MPAIDDERYTRRSLLKTAGGVVGMVGAVPAETGSVDWFDGGGRCPDATIRPEEVFFDDDGLRNCSDDHPVTRDLKASVKKALETRYSTVGPLIRQGFVPYFDFVAADGEDAWSHWINPDFLEDETILDPERPASILIDHKWWRPFGAMFVATRRDGLVELPPPVYSDESAAETTPCLPWHAHVGLPGRYAWWKYRLLYRDASWWESRQLPCRTPWVLHVWAYPHPKSVFAHHAAPRGYRGGAPAEPAGFDTDAVPGDDPLSVEVLPTVLQRIATRWHREG